MPRSEIMDDTRGLMKFVIDADTDEILGAALLCIDSQELINLVAHGDAPARHRLRTPRHDLHPPDVDRGDR